METACNRKNSGPLWFHYRQVSLYQCTASKVQLLVHFLPTPVPISFSSRRKIVMKLNVSILVDDEYNVCLGGNSSTQLSHGYCYKKIVLHTFRSQFFLVFYA